MGKKKGKGKKGGADFKMKSAPEPVPLDSVRTAGMSLLERTGLELFADVSGQYTSNLQEKEAMEKAAEEAANAKPAKSSGGGGGKKKGKKKKKK